MDVRDLAEWLREELKQVHAKLDRVQAHNANVDVTLASQAKDIAHHIKRTDLLEAQQQADRAAVKPTIDYVTRLKIIGWFVGAGIGAAATVVGVLVSLGRLFGQ